MLNLLSHHESSGTSKVSVITEVLIIMARISEWVKLGECMNGVTQFSTGNYFSTFEKGLYLRKFFLYFLYIYIFFLDYEFPVICFFLSCSFSRKVSHLVELKTNISVLYNITTLF